MGEEFNNISNVNLLFSSQLLLPLPPNVVFRLGEGRDGGQSPANILSAFSYATL